MSIGNIKISSNWPFRVEYHNYHMVSPSVLPLVMSQSILILFYGIFLFLHFYGGELFFFGFIFFTCFFFIWAHDVYVEGELSGMHTTIVSQGMKMGIILFIISEVMFFFSFFWAFFTFSLVPVGELGYFWPPIGIWVFDPFSIPLLNTVILLMSGLVLTSAHYNFLIRNLSRVYENFILTLSLAFLFTIFQFMEYFESPFSLNDGVYGSIFFMATGFHGLHVIIGSIWLSVSFFRLYFNKMPSDRHVMLEGAIWYWHFVDVVWLFLFFAVYYWGGN